MERDGAAGGPGQEARAAPVERDAPQLVARVIRVRNAQEERPPSCVQTAGPPGSTGLYRGVAPIREIVNPGCTRWSVGGRIIKGPETGAGHDWCDLFPGNTRSICHAVQDRTPRNRVSGRPTRTRGNDFLSAIAVDVRATGGAALKRESSRVSDGQLVLHPKGSWRGSGADAERTFRQAVAHSAYDLVGRNGFPQYARNFE
jgi:hypothetical protein